MWHTEMTTCSEAAKPQDLSRVCGKGLQGARLAKEEGQVTGGKRPTILNREHR